MRKLIYTFFSLTCLMVATPAWADKACFEVLGMTCTTCPLTVRSAVKKLKGINEVTASLEEKNAVVDFDSQKINTIEIKKAIDGVGYKAIPQECKKKKG